MIYGCHSEKAPGRCMRNSVKHSSGKTKWQFIFTRTCNYDNKDKDSKCNGCTQPRKEMI